MLRTILWLKYKIKDNEVFEKAYKYVEMYYTPDNGGPSFQAKEVNINEESRRAADPLVPPVKDQKLHNAHWAFSSGLTKDAMLSSVLRSHRIYTA